MSTGAIIAIVAGVLILLVLLAVLVPRMRSRSADRHRDARRQELADSHRQEAETREARARLAEGEAQRERAEAELHAARADLHDRGLADDEVDEVDRDSDPDTASERHEHR